METQLEVHERNNKHWLGVKLCPPFRNRIYRLVDAAGGAEALWEMDTDGLVALGLTPELAAESVAFRAAVSLEEEYNKLRSKGVSIVTSEEDIFPELLRYAEGHPRALFVKGNLEPYSTAVAIVGARRSTSHGKILAEELAAELAEEGIVIVSGGARGIDSAAHKGALEAGGVTLAVLGSGPDIIYPPENRQLFERVIENGAIISEYPPGTIPMAHNFPARNRIVAGMCKAVIVVEASEKSGALITADFALEYGREVFAAPGFSKNETSKGTNKLIKQGAFLIEDASDVFEVLGIKSSRAGDNGKLDALSDKERDVLNIIGWEPRRLDEIAREISLCETGATGSIGSAGYATSAVSELSILLVILEINGYLKKDIAGSYVRVK
ncbi:MAG TPA: DNA-processing protein DprA [Candidatus Aquicultor sp.]